MLSAVERDESVTGGESKVWSCCADMGSGWDGEVSGFEVCCCGRMERARAGVSAAERTSVRTILITSSK